MLDEFSRKIEKITKGDCISYHRCSFDPETEELEIGEKRGGYFRLEYGTYRAWTSSRAPPIEERDKKHHSRRNPHISLRLLFQTLKSSKYDGQEKKKSVEKACKGFLGQKPNPFRTLSERLFEERDPEYFDVADSLISLAKQVGLDYYASAIEQEVFTKDRREGNRDIYRF